MMDESFNRESRTPLRLASRKVAMLCYSSRSSSAPFLRCTHLQNSSLPLLSRLLHNTAAPTIEPPAHQINNGHLTTFDQPHSGFSSQRWIARGPHLATQCHIRYGRRTSLLSTPTGGYMGGTWTNQRPGAMDPWHRRGVDAWPGRSRTLPPWTALEC